MCPSLAKSNGCYGSTAASHYLTTWEAGIGQKRSLVDTPAVAILDHFFYSVAADGSVGQPSFSTVHMAADGSVGQPSFSTVHIQLAIVQ